MNPNPASASDPADPNPPPPIQPPAEIPGFLPLLLGREPRNPIGHPLRLLKDYTQISSLLSQQPSPSPAGLASHLLPFLGLGAGLTPSGDDLILGLILALARCGPSLGAPVDPAALAAEINPIAARRTTALSASLLAAAANGQADERLILALDSLAYGQLRLSG